MSEESDNDAIIVVHKHAAHTAHGGSWKVAFADFAVAMMAFFMLMWLMGGTSDEQQKQIAGYFKRPQDYPPVYDQIKSSVITPLTDAPPAVNGTDAIAYGAPKEQPPNVSGLDIVTEGVVTAPTSASEQDALDQLQTSLQDEINNSEDFSPFKKQIYISAVPEGVKLEIVDNEKQAMFSNGSAELAEETAKILMKLAPVIQRVPNHISITGHTDAAPFISTTGQTNWELSADRANSARRALEIGGVSPDKITQVVGQGSTALFDATQPNSPLNRRISIVILNSRTDQSLRGSGKPPQEDALGNPIKGTHIEQSMSPSQPATSVSGLPATPNTQIPHSSISGSDTSTHSGSALSVPILEPAKSSPPTLPKPVKPLPHVAPSPLPFESSRIDEPPFAKESTLQ